MNHSIKFLLKGGLAALCVGAVLPSSAMPPLPDRVEFNRHIRPVLSNNCFFCHGPDSKTQEAGMTYGATDDLGYNAVENVVTVHDFHATMLHQMGIDHEKLTYRFQSRDFRLTDIGGNVVKDILV